MTKRRVAPLLLIAILLSGGVAIWNRSSAERPRLTGSTSLLSAESAADVAAAPAGSRVVHFWSADEKSVSSALRPQAPIALGADAAQLVGEVAALQLLAKNTDLDLSPRQWTALASVTLHYQAVRQAYEASIATAAAVGEGRCRLEIPAYAAAGDALRNKFYAELREQLGATSAEEVVGQLGASLEGHFGGFGVSVQTLDFAADAGGVDTNYQVTRTVKYWNSVEGSDRLTTRRETHFPGLEDPSGHTWGPFLSLLAARAAKTGS